jgi:hypothetical protein
LWGIWAVAERNLIIITTKNDGIFGRWEFQRILFGFFLEFHHQTWWHNWDLIGVYITTKNGKTWYIMWL